MLKPFLIQKVTEQKGDEKVEPRSPQSNGKGLTQSLKFGRFTSYSVT
jgi:hypothetical protein